MRATRVIYVENDPALRGIMTQLLESRPELEIIVATGMAHEVLDDRLVATADVALLDLALGTTQMNGIDLGLALRSLNENIGIVIHSQYRLDTVARAVPRRALVGWATLEKSGAMDIREVAALLRSTARGESNMVIGDDTENLDDAESPLESLSMRQRAVIGMAAAGIKTPEIARRLHLSPDAVRQDLSRSYRTLVPDAGAIDDLRTRAILAYLELIRDDDAGDGR